MKNILPAILKISMPLFLLLTFSSPSYAVYQIDKIRLALSSEHGIDSIKLSNPDSEKTVNLQVNTFSWSQNNGEDVYTPTTDIIAAPPIARIQPKKMQILRIGWRKVVPLQQELAYRIYIHDVSPKDLNQTGVQLKINLGIPVFIQPSIQTFSADWKAARVSKDLLKVVLKNTGNMHLQFIAITLTDTNKKILSENKLPFYLLTQQTKEFQIPIKNFSGKTILISADTDHEKIVNTIDVT